MLNIQYLTKHNQISIEQHTIQDHFKSEEGLIWIDITEPTEADIAFLRETFNFHPLALEDTTNQKQRPKAEEFEDHLFIILNVYHPQDQTEKFTELDIFVSKNYFITIHKNIETIINRFQIRINIPTSNFKLSTTYLLYIFFDEVVDSYRDLLETVEDDMNTLSSQIFTQANSSTLNQLFEFQQLLGQISRILNPHLEIVKTLTNHQLVFIDKNTLYHLRDITDHLMYSLDMIRHLRDTANNLLNLYISAESNQLNKNITRLAILTITIGVLTIISGFYGMNFEKTFPSFSADWGILFALGLMILTSLAGFYIYRRQ